MFSLTDGDSETDNFETLIKIIIQNKRFQCFGVILDYDEGKGLCSVQPVPILNYYNLEGTDTSDQHEQAVIHEVPLLLLGSESGVISYELEPRARCWLLWSQYDLNNYNKDLHATRSHTQFLYHNVVAIPITTKEPFLKQEGLTIQNKKSNTYINIKNNSDVEITTSHGTNIIKSDGSVVFSNGATITSDGNVITAKGTDLDKFKAEYDAHTHIGNLGTPTSSPS